VSVATPLRSIRHTPQILNQFKVSRRREPLGLRGDLRYGGSATRELAHILQVFVQVSPSYPKKTTTQRRLPELQFPQSEVDCAEPLTDDTVGTFS
jgi:hypothetical protein